MHILANPVATEILPAGHGRPVSGRVVLDYEARCLRRKRLQAEDGTVFLVDLPQTVSLSGGEGFCLDDGRVIDVACAFEPVVEVRGPDLARLAWHIGNRHFPCGFQEDGLVIRADPVIEAMLVQLGASLGRKLAPFRPEGGAYGHGRTFGHSH